MWKSGCRFLIWTILGSALLAGAWNVVYANDCALIYTEVDRWEVELTEVTRDGELVEDLSGYGEPPVTLLSHRGGVRLIVGEEPDRYDKGQESDNYFLIHFGRGSIPNDMIDASKTNGDQQ